MTPPTAERRSPLDRALFRLLVAAWLIAITATYLRLLLTRLLVMHGYDLAP